jgi:ATP-binding cassette subfamily B protein
MDNLFRLLRFLKPYQARFTVSATLAALSIGADLVIPMIFGWTISRGLESGEMRQVIIFAGLLILAQGARSVINYFQWTVQHQVGQNVVRDLRNQIYARLQALPTSFYRDMPTGQIMSRVTSDVEAVQEYLGWGFLIQGMALLAFSGTSIILFMLDWQLRLVLYLPLVVRDYEF